MNVSLGPEKGRAFPVCLGTWPAATILVMMHMTDIVRPGKGAGAAPFLWPLARGRHSGDDEHDYHVGPGIGRVTPVVSGAVARGHHAGDDAEHYGFV